MAGDDNPQFPQDAEGIAKYTTENHDCSAVADGSVCSSNWDSTPEWNREIMVELIQRLLDKGYTPEQICTGFEDKD